MSNTKSNKLAVTISVLLSVVLLAAAGWAILNRQYIVDQIIVWQYEPSSEVSTISQKLDLSDLGNFYINASQTQVANAAEFNNACTRQESGSAVLGCYTNKRIFVYNVTDGELNGVEEVTAAHEMLHAAWDRLTDGEKARLGSLLEVAYERINDPDLNERMAYYARTEPGERTNELHSILATEYVDIGDELDAYFAKYFTDRSAVVSLYVGYKSVFDNLQAQSDTLAGEMSSLKRKIEAQTTQYNTEADALTIAIADLQRQAQTVDRSNATAVNAYNAQRRVIIARIDELDMLKAATNTDVSTYNEKVKQYNALITSSNELTQSLDSTLAPSPGL
jgi:phage shock protein A